MRDATDAARLAFPQGPALQTIILFDSHLTTSIELPGFQSSWVRKKHCISGCAQPCNLGE